jgi:hypothetical protein
MAVALTTLPLPCYLLHVTNLPFFLPKLLMKSVTLEEQPKTQTIQGFNVTDATDVRNMNYKY